MKKIVTVLFLCMLMPVVFAVEPEVNEPTKINTSQIEGKIVDGITGEALVGVTLTINGSDEKIYTDLDGNFRISDLNVGTYDIDINYVSYKGICLKSISTSSSDVALKVKLESVSPEKQ